MLAQALPCMYYATRNTSITVLNVLQAVKPALISSVLASLLVFSIKIAIASSLPMWITIIIYSIVMSLVYIWLMLYVFKMKAFYLSFLHELKKGHSK